MCFNHCKPLSSSFRSPNVWVVPHLFINYVAPIPCFSPLWLLVQPHCMLLPCSWCVVRALGWICSCYRHPFARYLFISLQASSNHLRRKNTHQLHPIVSISAPHMTRSDFHFILMRPEMIFHAGLPFTSRGPSAMDDGRLRDVPMIRSGPFRGCRTMGWR